MSWLRQHAEALEAIAAVLTALIALAALIAIPWQIRATAQLQAEQSARDIYREFVALSVNKPEFASPDYCSLVQEGKSETAYRYYVEYLLYTAEQVTSVDDQWRPVMEGHMSEHQAFFCSNQDWTGDTELVAELVTRQLAQCDAVTSCQ